METRLTKAIRACIENSSRLIDNSDMLLYDSFATSFYLAIIAQEEIAKAFILYLILHGTMEWKDAKEIIKDHRSKQLLLFIIDYIEPDFEEWNRRHLDNFGKPLKLPQDIGHALNTLVLDKIKKYERYFWLDEGEKISNIVDRISSGRYDNEKQNALYVMVNDKFQIINDPKHVTKEQAEFELDKARRLNRFIRIDNGDISGPYNYEFEYIDAVLKLLLGKITVEEYSKLV